MKSFLCVLLCILIPVCALAGEYDLPLDIAQGGYEPNPACFTDDGYTDDSLTIRVEKRDVEGVRYDLVWITVKSPTQLRTATSGKPNEAVLRLPSRMGKAKNAVALINGEYYIQRTRGIFTYRQGKMYRNDPDPLKDVLIIDAQGDFHIFTSPEKQTEIEQYMADGGTIVNAFSFGPGMVVDGKVATIRDDYIFESKKVSPRSVIAQVGPLSYLFVEAEGRVAWSTGVTHQEMADFMGTLGVQQAYNLDGGGSSTLMVGSQYVDDKTPRKEREQSDIIYVCTAVDDSAWK